MSISLRRLCEWKKEDGYSYVAVNEYTKGLEFIKEDDLECWYIENFLKYAYSTKERKFVMTLDEYKKQNPVDRIEEFFKKNNGSKDDSDIFSTERIKGKDIFYGSRKYMESDR